MADFGLCVYNTSTNRPCGVWVSRGLAQTYIFFGGWGDFFHLFLSYFPWNLGNISRNFFAQTKTSSLLRCGKYEFKPQFAAFFIQISPFMLGLPIGPPQAKKIERFQPQNHKNGLKWVRVACDFKGSGEAPASRQREQGIFLSPGKVGIFLKIFPET